MLPLAEQVQVLEGQIVSKALVQTDHHSLTIFAFDKDEEIKYGCMQSLDQLPTSQAQEINFAMCEKFKEFLPLAMIESHHED